MDHLVISDIDADMSDRRATTHGEEHQIALLKLIAVQRSAELLLLLRCARQTNVKLAIDLRHKPGTIHSVTVIAAILICRSDPGIRLTQKQTDSRLHLPSGKIYMARRFRLSHRRICRPTARRVARCAARGSRKKHEHKAENEDRRFYKLGFHKFQLHFIGKNSHFQT